MGIVHNMKAEKVQKSEEQQVDLYNKYRPTTFDDVVGQDPVVNALKSKIEQRRVPRFIFFASESNTPGVGKNTLSRIIASKLLDIDTPMKDPYRQYEEYSCSQNGGVGDIREVIDRVRNTPPNSRPGKPPIKVLMLDEVHKASSAAISALLQVTENPPPWLFIIAATTDIKKIRKGKDTAPLVSRAEVYELKRLSPAHLMRIIARISKAERIKVSEEVLSIIANQADGSAREAISLLSKVRNSSEEDSIKLLQRYSNGDESPINQLVMSLLYGYYIPEGGTWQDRQMVSSYSDKYRIITNFIRNNPNKESARVQLVSYLNSMAGIGERETPSPAIAKELSKDGNSSKLDRVLSLLEQLTSLETSYSGPDGEGGARLLVALSKYAKEN